MDGNSTIAFFTAYGGGLLGIAQVGTAVVLVFFTYKLFKATNRDADLVQKQNDMMRDTQDHELLLKKYNRMLDEMKDFVAPLYGRRKDPQIFSDYEFGSQLLGISSSENLILPEYFEFWKNIHYRLYLNQSKELQKCLDVYLESIGVLSTISREVNRLHYSTPIEGLATELAQHDDARNKFNFNQKN